MSKFYKLLLGVIAVGAFALPFTAFAAIGFDNSSKSNAGAVSTLTYSHTVNSNTNGALYCFESAVDTNNRAIPSVTYAGVTMTNLVSQTNTPATLGNRQMGMWRLLLPSTGANNVVFTWGGAIGQTVAVACTSFTGVNQSTPEDGSAVQDIDTTPPYSTFTLSKTTTVDNDWLVGFALNYGSNSNAVSAGTNTTIRQQAVGDTGNNALVTYDTNAAQTPTGSKSLNLSLSPSNDMSGFMYAIEPAASSPVVSWFNVIQSFIWGDW